MDQLIKLKGEEFGKQIQEVSRDISEFIFFEKIRTIVPNTELSYMKALYFSWIKEGLESGRKT